ncbi:MAG: hypothetical protein CTY12_00420 [Methylotenera sp.]|nr:MAG: hypothetical protein CTY12_00420 [Methylotenera sp.]
MSVRVFVASNLDQKREFAKQAVDNHLYYSGWMLFDELNNIQCDKQGEITEICVAIDDQTPIGVAIYYTPIDRSTIGVGSVFPAHSVICFVKQNKRRKGIGRKMIESFGVPLSDMKSWRGEEQSSKFWTNIGTNYRGVWDWSDAA